MHDFATAAAGFLGTHPYTALVSLGALILVVFAGASVLFEVLAAAAHSAWEHAACCWPRLATEAARARMAGRDAAVDTLLLHLAEQNGIGRDGDGQWRTSRGTVLPDVLQDRANHLEDAGYVEEHTPAQSAAPHVPGTVRVTDDGYQRLTNA